MNATCAVVSPSSTSPPARTWSWWFVPDVALIIGIATLFYILVPFDGTRELMRDSDAGWHIRNGESILNGNPLPRVDPYSLTRYGQTWFAWEWGADVIMGFLHQRGGMALVTAFFGSVIAACMWLWFRLNARLGGNFLIAAAFIPLCLTSTQTHWHARPHVLSWLILLAAIWYAERRRRSLWVVAIVSAIWANVHASFFFGAAICAIYAAGHLIRPLLWSDTDRAYEFREARWFATAAVVSAISTLVNPYSWSVHMHVVQYLGNTDLMERIGEFQPFSYHGSGSWPILLAMILAAVGGVLAWTQRRIEHALLTVLLVSTALRSARGLSVVALLCLPLANAYITQALRQASGLNAYVRRWLDGFLQYSENLWRFDRRFAGPVTAAAVLVFTALVLRIPTVHARAGFSDTRFPAKAAQHLEKLPPTIRLLSTDFFGGYIIYRFNGQLKVFFDGRSDFYGVPFIKEYMDLIELRAGWREQLKKLRFDYALLPKRYSLVPALQEMGWKQINADEVAVLLQSPDVTPK